MNLKQALTLAGEKLAAVPDIDNPKLEAEILLKHTLQIDRVQLHLNRNSELPADKEQLFQKFLERRLQGEPTAYIIRQREFYGLDFYVDSRVLIPRPETELLVEEALKLAPSPVVRTIADIGTGSGAIAVSLAVNIYRSSFNSHKLIPPFSPQIYATDISSAALEVARLNSQKHEVKEHITFLQGDLLDPLPESVDILIANLPYVTQAEVDQMPSAYFEPRQALDGGETGLDQIMRLADQLKNRASSGSFVLLEIGMGQSPTLKKHLQSLFPKAQIEILPDLAGIERVLKMRI